MDAHKFDMILKYISDEQNRNIHINGHKLKKDLFPDLHLDQISNLLDEMEYIKPEVFKRFKKGATSPIQANGLTIPFLETGGFTEIKTKISLEKQKAEEKEIIEFEKSKVDLELAKKTLKEFPRTKWFARIGFVIAVVLALKELYMLLKPLLLG